jgi:two-component system, OmpR family, sensor kinase
VIPLRSVGTRLSLALLAIVAAGLAFVYMIVVPPLEDRLVDGKLDQLEAVAGPVALQLKQPISDADAADPLQSVAVGASARALVVEPLARNVLRVTDVAGDDPSVYRNDPVGLRALEFGEVVRETVERGGERFAEVAVPYRADDQPRALLLASPLREQMETVDTVERRLLIAGILALAGAVLLGYGGSWLFARRLRRLEHAAERIAAGHFDEPIVDRGRDEIGQLAAAFERMRLRLAQLEHARREFVANASHELRTPLFSIAGSLELLADEELDKRTRREFIVTMREQVDRLSRLAADLLDLSRLDAGRIAAEAEPVELGAIAQALGDEFRAVAQAREHVLEVNGQSPIRAVGDEQWILRTGRALVENALVHTPPGTTVRVRVSRDGEHARLSVEDDGPGIPSEHLEHVFERFYRIEGDRASGSGLGLAIARELAQLMGGAVSVVSEPGRTVFTVSLPDARENGLVTIATSENRESGSAR